MKIGIVGLGIVGSTLKFGFEKLGHNVIGYDINDNSTQLEHVLDCDLIYIAVPTPINSDGKCDISIVKRVVSELNSLFDNHYYSYGKNYPKNIIIKSTVEPGTTSYFQHLFPSLNFAFVPEFLRERCAIVDFVELHNLLAIGTDNDEIFDLVVKSHGNYPKNTVRLTSIEAEFLKYYHNAIAALRIIFANEMYELAAALEIDYIAVKNALIKSTQLPDKYLDVSKNLRGFCGTCLPKDTLALLKLAEDYNVDLDLLETVVVKNQKYQPTVYPGMRP